MKQRRDPVRTCVGCGESDAKRGFIRIVRTPEGDVAVDATGKANGRGAYVCAKASCFDAAARRRLSAALRVTLKEDDIDRLRREFESAVAESSSEAHGG